MFDNVLSTIIVMYWWNKITFFINFLLPGWILHLPNITSVTMYLRSISHKATVWRNIRKQKLSDKPFTRGLLASPSRLTHETMTLRSQILLSFQTSNIHLAKVNIRNT